MILSWLDYYNSFSTDLPAFVSVYFLHNSQNNLFNNKSHNITPLLKMTSNVFPISLKRKFLTMASRSDMLCLPSNSLFFLWPHFLLLFPISPFYSIVASLLFLEYTKRTSASGPWHLLSFLSRTSLPRGTHMLLPSDVGSNAILLMGSSLTMIYKTATHPISPIPLSPLPYLLFFIVLTSWHCIIICLWSISSIRIQTPWGQRLYLFCSLL